MLDIRRDGVDAAVNQRCGRYEVPACLYVEGNYFLEYLLCM